MAVVKTPTIISNNPVFSSQVLYYHQIAIHFNIIECTLPHSRDLRYVLFWDFTQSGIVVYYRSLGTNYWSRNVGKKLPIYARLHRGVNLKSRTHYFLTLRCGIPVVLIKSQISVKHSQLDQCCSTFVRPRPGKFFFHKTRARS